jgi:quercetin dioxygenase-like cupin family protein
MSNDKKVVVVDANKMEWRECPNPIIPMSNYIKMLHEDDDTGMRVNLCFYPRGFMTKWHKHPCGHGLYVLEGLLKTSEGILGPGSFIWFEEGVIAEHGATAETDVLTLFITNKEFAIDYIDSDS